jgi:hypothetical protein
MGMFGRAELDLDCALLAAKCASASALSVSLMEVPQRRPGLAAKTDDAMVATRRADFVTWSMDEVNGDDFSANCHCIYIIHVFQATA